jgi:hypothetical protein
MKPHAADNSNTPERIIVPATDGVVFVRHTGGLEHITQVLGVIIKPVLVL